MRSVWKVRIMSADAMPRVNGSGYVEWFNRFAPVIDRAGELTDHRFRFDIWHTGGGCHNYATWLADDYAEPYDDETPYALLGNVYSSPHEWEPAVCAYVHRSQWTAQAGHEVYELHTHYDDPNCEPCQNVAAIISHRLRKYEEDPGPDGRSCYYDTDKIAAVGVAQWLADAATAAFSLRPGHWSDE